MNKDEYIKIFTPQDTNCSHLDVVGLFGEWKKEAFKVGTIMRIKQANLSFDKNGRAYLTVVYWHELNPVTIGEAPQTKGD